MKKWELYTSLFFIFLLLFFHVIPALHSQTLDEYKKELNTLTGAKRVDFLNNCSGEFYYKHKHMCIENYYLALSLANKLNYTKGKASALINLANSYYDEKMHEKSIDYYIQADELYQDLNNISRSAFCTKQIGMEYSKIKRRRKAIQYLLKSSQKYGQVGNKREQSYIFCKIGSIYQSESDFQKAINFYEKSRKIAQEIGIRKDIGRGLFYLGNAYSELSMYDIALENYQKSYKILDGNDINIRPYALNNIGLIYLEMSEPKKALKIFNEVLSIWQKFNRRWGETSALINLGTTYFQLKNSKKAIEVLEKALPYADKNKLHSKKANIHRAMGKVYYAQQNYRESLKHFSISKKCWENAAYKKDIVACDNMIGKIYLNLKNPAESFKYLSRSHQRAKELGLKDILKDNSRNFSEYYRIKGDYKKALIYYKLFHKIDKEIFDEKSEKNLTGLQIKFETEQKEDRIKLLEQKDQISALSLSRARILRDALIIGIGLVFIIFVLLFRRYLNLFAFWQTQRVVGDFKLIEKLGYGSYGSVWKSTNRTDKSQVAAVKILNEDMLDESTIRRFRHEGTVTEGLNHQNIVKILSKGEYQIKEEGELKDKLYIAMEYLDGMTLDQKIKDQGKFSIAEECHIAGQITDALTYIHGKGIIHRDLKPGNIMVINNEGDENFVKLLDFGLAKSSLLSKMTQTGMVIGTTRYISPEQALGQKITTASDIFSLGLILYEMITGKHAFPADTYPNETILVKAIIEDPPDEPREINKEISKELNTLILQMLEKEPKKRPKAEIVLNALKQISE